MKNIKKVRLILKEDNIEYTKDKITTTLDVIRLLNKVEQANLLPEESMFLICMNNKNEVISYSEVAKGGANYCCLDMKTIFKITLLANANKIILVHNHPSGDSTPSQEDIQMTERIKKACNIMSITLLDHLVIAGSSYASCMNSVKEVK